MEHGPELFESAWLKWSWAVAHTEAFKAHYNAWRNDPERKLDITLGTNYDAKHHRIDVLITGITPLPIEWGLVIGDIAHNYRSCLDHIAWALATRGRTPPNTLSDRDQRVINFPICDERDGDRGFNTVVDGTRRRPSALPGVRRADKAVVRRYQPYHGGKRKCERHALGVLRRISNDDKHRSVQPAQIAPRGATYHLGDTRDCVVTRVPESFVVRNPLQVGAKLAPIYVRKTGPQPEADVQGQFAAQPAIQGVELGAWLETMPRFVSGILRELSDPPTELLSKLGVSLP